MWIELGRQSRSESSPRRLHSSPTGDLRGREAENMLVDSGTSGTILRTLHIRRGLQDERDVIEADICA